MTPFGQFLANVMMLSFLIGVTATLVIVGAAMTGGLP
jgi:hypothetical protein